MKTREETLQIATGKQFDVIVIGGGIAGAGVAQDASARGLSVLLLEKGDFSSGTSSKTTKLIHGGLRYLEQFQFALIRQLCQERSLLQQLAPHMVRDFSFVMPIPKDKLFFALKAELGLSLYDILSWPMSMAHPHKRLSDREVIETSPALSATNISYGLRFHDCITDDARLVIEVLKSANFEGALTLNYMRVTGFQLSDEEKITTVTCRDRISGSEVSFGCRVCVNAAGVWSDELCKMIDPHWIDHLVASKGIHIVVPSSAFETNTALFLPTKDERYVFVVPWQQALLIGTTDSMYEGNLDEPLARDDEIDYLLSVVNGYTQSHKLTRGDITSVFVGLRPLIEIDKDSTSTQRMVREHLVYEGPGGMIGLSGGKLTNYRLMASSVVDKIFKSLPYVPYSPCRTNSMMLGGWLNKQDFLASTAQISARARKLSIEPAVLDHLIATYGADARTILEFVEKDAGLNERICLDFPPIMAEIPFCVFEEMTISLEDLLMRRLRLGILNRQQCLDSAPKVAMLMKEFLGWNMNRVKSEIAALEHTLSDDRLIAKTI